MISIGGTSFASLSAIVVRISALLLVILHRHRVLLRARFTGSRLGAILTLVGSFSFILSTFLTGASLALLLACLRPGSVARCRVGSPYTTNTVTWLLLVLLIAVNRRVIGRLALGSRA